ncbi:VgrG-related protein [Actinacidiphila acididurans]|uniref:VgrG-related protein n=1 Tax=Actinacidiphila acididurans TaxID=2784346 RepID=A0ABS2TTN2_9ACTN|nr:VgrG-related protein [Actinacidiphila acididurans]MBM9506695.1 VgrG-related protein [Actinacidiphila acididurans]
MAVNQSVAKALVVECGGRPLAAALANTLVEAYVEDSRTLPGVFVLRFRDPARVLLDSAGIAVGTPVRLLAAAGGPPSPRPLLTGAVTALELEIDDGGTFTVVRGMDESYRLFRGRRVAGYQNMTLTDICTQVARRAGLRPGPMEVAGPVLEHVVQPNVSDWVFLKSLADPAGAQVYVEDGALHVVGPADAAGAPEVTARAARDPLVLEMGDNLLRCRAAVSAAEQVTEVEVRGWDVQTKRPLVGHADAGTSSTLRLAVTAADLARPFGPANLLVGDTAYGDQARVDQAARTLAARVAGSFAELDAVIRGNPEVRAGTAVTLAGVGRPFEGRWTVTSARHVFDPDRGYETWIGVSGDQDRSLHGLAADPAGPDGRCFGLVNATVTDTKDPQGLGRVKVRFPWLSDDYTSDWARCAQAGGTGGGEAFIPEVGEEVLVGFEQGRLDHPYVLCALYNGKDRPAGQGSGSGHAVDPTSGAVNRRALASREGNKLELLDAAAGPQGVRVVTGDGKLHITLDRRQTAITVHSDGSVRIEAGTQVSVTAGSGVVLDAGKGRLRLTGDVVEVAARSGLQMDAGSGPVTVSGGGAVAVRGKQVTVDGTDRTDLRGGSSLTVAAPMVRIN